MTACGARSYALEPCWDPELTRPCEGPCGAGEQACDGLEWGECEVPEAELPCEHVCGPGLQTCREGELGECEVVDPVRSCDHGCGVGQEFCGEEGWTDCNAPLPVLRGIVRDFSSDHPDFEQGLPQTVVDGPIVSPMLGVDGRPVYLGGPGGTATTSGPATFAAWFADVPGVNRSTSVTLEVTRRDPDSPVYEVVLPAFFPIDGTLLGNEGRIHNFHFTFVAEATFQYMGGEVFEAAGDDDVWLFINGRLALDIGGLHPANRTETIELDAEAGRLGLEIGGRYPLHLFFAERQTVGSALTFRTTADAFQCG